MTAVVEMSEASEIAAWEKAGRDLFAFKTKEGFQPVALHLYRAPDGSILYARVRMHKAALGGEHEKLVRPFYHDGARWTHGEPKQNGGKVLYGLPDVSAFPEALVVLTEGEQKSDALTRLGDGRFIGVTSGGATSAGGADWSPLAGRRVLLWPDNDAPGQRYADETTEKLRALGCAIDRLDVAAAGLPESGDVIDWLDAFKAANGHEPGADDVLSLPTVRLIEQTSADAAPSSAVMLQCAADIKPEAITWLWPGWLPAGKLTILAGAPGTGKTTLALALAGTVTTGSRWPDGSACNSAGGVLMWSSEDDPADTLVPRLIATGADLNRVHFVGSVTNQHGEIMPFDPARDVPLLSERIAQIGGARLLIVDPIVSAVSGDAHRANDVRRDLQSLVDMAARHGCAVLGISHFSKGSKGSSPAERVIGSQAFTALARMVLVAGKDEAAERRILARAKSNIAPDDGGISYGIEQAEAAPGIEASRIVWGEKLEGTAREILGDVEDSADEERTGQEEARDFLASILADGPMRTREIKADADGAGFNWKMMQRAASKLGVEKRKVGMKEGWEWAIPKETRHEEDTKNTALYTVSPSGFDVPFGSGKGLRAIDFPVSPEGDIAERADSSGNSSRSGTVGESMEAV
ncbi:AAA family ATPase [Burkholderia ubonensis]|uniref:AAA family ATPase n=1 Tax=Burkholderia ubonensis TaxID=101571 RepID=UPI000B0BAAF8|nr:AAA family ATPase [Burkholderia ubonensis]